MEMNDIKEPLQEHSTNGGDKDVPMETSSVQKKGLVETGSDVLALIDQLSSLTDVTSLREEAGKIEHTSLQNRDDSIKPFTNLAEISIRKMISELQELNSFHHTVQRMEGDVKSLSQRLDGERKKNSRLELELSEARKKTLETERASKRTSDQWRKKCSTMDNQLRVIQSRLGQEQNKNEKLCTKLQSKIETKESRVKQLGVVASSDLASATVAEKTISRTKHAGLHVDLNKMQEKYNKLQDSLSSLTEKVFKLAQGKATENDLYRKLEAMTQQTVTPHSVKILEQCLSSLMDEGTQSDDTKSLSEDRENTQGRRKRTKMTGEPFRHTTKTPRVLEPNNVDHHHEPSSSMNSSKGGVSFTVGL